MRAFNNGTNPHNFVDYKEFQIASSAYHGVNVNAEAHVTNPSEEQ